MKSEVTVHDTNQRYIPALRYRRLTRYYDRFIRWTLRDEGFKRTLVEQARPEAGHRVLDIGCGTAGLTILLKQAAPNATVIGLDADPDALAIGRGKAATRSVDIELRRGTATAPPFERRSFDRVVSSLFFHHLTRDDKLRSLQSVRELLRPGGELHVADWGKAQGALMRTAFLAVQLLDGFATTTDNVRGRLPEFMTDVGFTEVRETRHWMTVFGTLSLYRAVVV